MTTPPPDSSDPAAPASPADPAGPVSLDKPGEPPAPLDFDPYRFGAPEHPVPPEYAPPGYVPPPSFAPPPQAPSVPTVAPGGSGGSGGYPGYPQTGYPNPGTPYAGGPYPGGPYPGGPYPGGPYAGGAPGAPGYHHYPQPRTGNGMAVASLVLGIASIVLCWISIIDVIPVALAVVFGLVALSRAKQMPRRDGRKLAIAGIACAVVGAIFATVLTVVIYARISDCLKLPSGSSEYTQCINSKL